MIEKLISDYEELKCDGRMDSAYVSVVHVGRIEDDGVDNGYEVYLVAVRSREDISNTILKALYG